MKKRSDAPLHAALAVLVVLTFYPFVFMVMTSFKDNNQVYHAFWWPTLPLHPGNYAGAWGAIARYMLNSIIITVSTVAGVLIVSSLSAYAFARHKFPGSKLLFYAILSLMMIPSVLSLVAAFMWVKRLGLLNTYWVVILPGIAGGQVFPILILRSFMASLPEELFEAARVDGASELQMYWRIAMPLSKPILGTVAIMNIIGVWNSFIWPLCTMTDDSMRPIAVGLRFFEGTYRTDYGPLMAGYTIAAIPLLVLFFFAMEYFIEGLTSGALKA